MDTSKNLKDTSLFLIMKGYIVGYIGEWADAINPIITGYYTTWNKGIVALKELENINIIQHHGLQKVYIVEIEVNKSYSIQDLSVNWIDNYKHHIAETVNDKIVLYGSNGKKIDLDPQEDEWKTVSKQNKYNKRR